MTRVTSVWVMLVVIFVVQGVVNVVLVVVLMNAHTKIRKLFEMHVTAFQIFQAHDKRIANIVENLPADDRG